MFRDSSCPSLSRAASRELRRHSGAPQSGEPESSTRENLRVSGFRVRAFGTPRNDRVGRPLDNVQSSEHDCGNEQKQRRNEMSYREVSEIRDGMRIDWDMPITMD